MSDGADPAGGAPGAAAADVTAPARRPAPARDRPDDQETPPPTGGRADDDRPPATNLDLVDRVVWLFFAAAVFYLLTAPFRGLCSGRDWLLWSASAVAIPAMVVADRRVKAIAADSLAPQPTWRDRRLRLPGALGALAILLAAGGLATATDEPRVRPVQIGIAPHGLASGDDALWVADPSGGAVHRLDATTGATLDRFELAGAFELSFADSAVWVTRLEPHGVTLLGVDGSTVGDLDLPGRPADIGSTSTQAWIALPDSGQVAVVDRERLDVELHDVGVRPSSLVAGSDAIWVTDTGTSSVLRLDPTTGDVTAEVDVDGEPIGIHRSGDQVWVSTTGRARIVAIDTRDLTTTTFRPPAATEPTDILADAGAIWVASSDQGQVVALDPVTREVLRSFDLGGRPIKLEPHGAFVAVSDSTDGTVHLIPTSLVSHECVFGDLDLGWPF